MYQARKSVSSKARRESTDGGLLARCLRHGYAEDALWERSVSDADGHDEVGTWTKRLVPSAGRSETMKQQYVDYQVVPYPKTRRWMAAAFRSVQHKPMIHGLLEVDVTRARARLREHQANTGESLSFTAFLTACLAKAVDEHKAVQARRFGSKRLIVFEEVDVYLPIEHDVAGQKHIMPAIIRAANRKTIREIHHEIRAAQVQDVEKVLKEGVLSLPTLLLGPFLWVFSWIGRRYPQMWKKSVGTVGITVVGMFGKGAGWGIPPAFTGRFFRKPPWKLVAPAASVASAPDFFSSSLCLSCWASCTGPVRWATAAPGNALPDSPRAGARRPGSAAGLAQNNSRGVAA